MQYFQYKHARLLFWREWLCGIVFYEQILHLSIITDFGEVKSQQYGTKSPKYKLWRLLNLGLCCSCLMVLLTQSIIFTMPVGGILMDRIWKRMRSYGGRNTFFFHSESCYIYTRAQTALCSKTCTDGEGKVMVLYPQCKPEQLRVSCSREPRQHSGNWCHYQLSTQFPTMAHSYGSNQRSTEIARNVFFFIFRIWLFNLTQSRMMINLSNLHFSLQLKNSHYLTKLKWRRKWYLCFHFQKFLLNLYQSLKKMPF